MNKYRAVKTIVDSISFHSRKEAARYRDLRLLELAGKIHSLNLQTAYRLEVNGILICKYLADFVYFDNDLQKWVCEDVKGIRTPIYRIKQKLMRAIHGIEILET
ncbi:MAG: DUF1064 domain-containing protein [Acidobacteriota bacterium]|nr:DUF1064 domain-containing protein [Acidobacteriota bacterium]